MGAAEAIVDENGFEALRVEEVVLRAGTAKGTFFAHFKDKDALMDLMIGGRIDALLDAQEAGPPPRTVKAMVTALMPVCLFMTCERYVFDVILRYSGAAGVEDIGVIATTFNRQVAVLERWLAASAFRSDIPVHLQAEGVQAFMLQAMALRFCNATAIDDRLGPYLRAWLTPKTRD